ncbi:MAG: tetratricopeptide repeat protein [Rhodospirillaceae bacterium]|nr:tetratricopeptide repeat protein [Rhodospirillaceae bacterium]
MPASSRTPLVFLLAASLSACAAGGAAPDKLPLASTASGNFLSGLAAQRGNDPGAAAEYYGAALKADPGDPQLLLRGLAVALQDGRGDTATDLAGRLIQLEPGNAFATLTLALADAKAERYAEAEKRLATLRRAGPNAILVPMLIAWARAGQKNFDQAVESLETGGSPQAELTNMFQLHAALINELGGRTEAAEKNYRTVLTGESTSLRTVLAAGRFFERTGRPNEAEPIYQKFTERSADPIYVQVDLARARAKGTPPQPIGKASDGMAEALFDLASALQSERTGDLAQIYVQSAIWLRPNYPAAKLLLGSLLESEQRYAEANAAYDAAGSDATYGWSAKLHIASNLDQMGKSDEAVKVLEAMANEQPERIDALVRLGDLWRSKVKQPGPFPEYDRALAAYDRAVARVGTPQQQHWSLFFSRAVVLERSGRWARAEPDLLKALELEPEQPSVLNYLGYSWADQRLHLDKALPMIERAVELRPRDGYIIDSLGWVHFRLGNVEKALGYMEQAVELRPQDPTINDHLGDVYWRAGRRAEARFQWERALRLEPEPEAVPQIQKKIIEGLPPP